MEIKKITLNTDVFMKFKTIAFMALLLLIISSIPAMAAECVMCGTKITGRYGMTDQGKICETCYWKLLNQQKNEQEQLKCSVCGTPLQGQYYQTHNNMPFCISCNNKYKDKCMTCGMPVPKGRGSRNGSYTTCEYCAKDLVTTASELRELYYEAKSFLKSEIGLTLPISPDRVYFSDRINMNQDFSRYRRNETPESYGQGNTVGLFIQDSSGMSIQIQKGMPRLEVLSTLVHEGAHSWMTKYGKRNPSLILSEGFAVWCEYKLFMSLGEDEYYKQKAQREDGVYGEGLKKMLRLESKLGASGILQYIMKHNDF